MLGTILLYVGIVLISNGLASIEKKLMINP